MEGKVENNSRQEHVEENDTDYVGLVEATSSVDKGNIHNNAKEYTEHNIEYFVEQNSTPKSVQNINYKKFGDNKDEVNSKSIQDSTEQNTGDDDDDDDVHVESTELSVEYSENIEAKVNIETVRHMKGEISPKNLRNVECEDHGDLDTEYVLFTPNVSKEVDLPRILTHPKQPYGFTT
eukprot:TRINITY_DN69_c0_g1_i2.p1 TRINITY_DN69_c0_g1~~TRINITY_DN69_c0_g1_i2.p1  ORF type:complete len:178 (-),score=50.36 TRINITY_DN69_c0_g1_i2:744-1277(-)